MLERIISVIGSLRLTVVCLVLALVLVFVGTIAQVQEGLYQAQVRYFKSLVIFWQPAAGVKIPVFPGGYLLGSVLVVNLLAAHARRYRPGWGQFGIHLIHAGLILMLLGQLATDLLSRESALWLRIGETKNFSEDFQASELAIIDETDPRSNVVYAIPESRLVRGREIKEGRLPLTVRVKEYWENSFLTNGPGADALASGATQGALKEAYIRPLPRTARTDERNIPSAVIELVATGGQSVGSWLVSSWSGAEQRFRANDRDYQVVMRFARYYKPYSLTLLEFTHERYKGTDIPKNFASRVRVVNPTKNESRETVIYMNNPLRYEGLTFYQASFEKGDKASMFQVVRNPGWLVPYLSCLLVGAGLVYQFSRHLLKFIRKQTA